MTQHYTNLSDKPSRRIRVAFFLDSFAIGGTELNAVRTAEALDPEVIELSVYFLQQRGPLKARYEKLGIPMTHLPIENLYSFGTVKQGIQVARMLRKAGVDIVHSHDIYTNIFAAPYVRMLSRCKVIASRRWWYESPRPELIPFNRMSYHFAHRVLANSHGVAKLLIDEENVPSKKVVEIPNFLSNEAFNNVSQATAVAQRIEWGIPENAFVVGIVARLSPVKNHSLLINAMAMTAPNVHLVLVGDGPSRSELEKQVHTLNIQERVHFLGEQITGSNLHQYFDVSVLCSTSEGFPNSVIEAMAAARPVVATPVGGVTDVVSHGETGLIVSSVEPASLAEAIRLLESDQALASRLGENGRIRIKKNYMQEVVIGRLLHVYESLVVKGSG